MHQAGGANKALNAKSKEFARKILSADSSDEDSDGGSGGKWANRSTVGVGKGRALEEGAAKGSAGTRTRPGSIDTSDGDKRGRRGSLTGGSRPQSARLGILRGTGGSFRGGSRTNSPGNFSSSARSIISHRRSPSPLSSRSPSPSKRKSSAHRNYKEAAEMWIQDSGAHATSPVRSTHVNGGSSFRSTGSGSGGGWMVELEERLRTSGARGRPPPRAVQRGSPSSSEDDDEGASLRRGDSDHNLPHGAVKTALASMWGHLEKVHSPIPSPGPGHSSSRSPSSKLWVIVAAEEDAAGYSQGEEVPISFAGMQHAMETGSVLRSARGGGGKRVLCGPSLASVQTAHYIAWCIGGRVCIEPGLAEPGCSKHLPHPSARQRRACHPTVDASFKPCTNEPWGEETMIEGLPRAVDAGNKIAASVGVDEDAIIVAGSAVATAVAAALASGCCIASGDKAHPLQLQSKLNATSPVSPCSIFTLKRGSQGDWGCDMTASASHISSPSPPHAPFELLAAGDPREWIALWECLRRLHNLCARGGSAQGSGEARLRADVALHSMGMARGALPTLLRGKNHADSSSSSINGGAHLSRSSASYSRSHGASANHGSSSRLGA